MKRVFSGSMDMHTKHLREVIKILRKNELYTCSSKCDFGQSSVNFLGHTISSSGLHDDSRKSVPLLSGQVQTIVRNYNVSLDL